MVFWVIIAGSRSIPQLYILHSQTIPTLQRYLEPFSERLMTLVSLLSRRLKPFEVS